MDWVEHQCSQDVEFGGREVVGVEASRPPEPLVGGRSVLSVDILGRLQEGIDKIRQELVISTGIGWPAILEDGGCQGIEGDSVGEVQQQADHQRHYHAPGDGSSQYPHEEDREIEHAEPEFSEQTLAAPFASRRLLVAIEPGPCTYHVDVVVVVVDKGVPGDKRRARGSIHVWPPISAGDLLPPLGMG